ncbi:MAG: ferredoxin III, nif-specific [Hydrogenophilales bacterium CG17_big_fil_post_rev_8_21_14_2_50_63_12]|nr:MAG: ferredoxin III, nif-specific [Hydrogenophilales bacterium CG17_big_fil_post_rev_8_21_14_2_50_63_12]PIX96679.1 MAG: ferredoxin III, nif-specific [Hydrogenophilales bacterium CG_4_10_14_3_um_filter_63_21]
MDAYSALTRGGTPYTPTFVVALDQKTCIGCGRCYKVCPRDVFELVERDEDEANENAMDEDLDEDQVSVMSLKNMLDCIGCGSCARVCPKGCHTHEALPIAA